MSFGKKAMEPVIVAVSFWTGVFGGFWALTVIGGWIKGWRDTRVRGAVASRTFDITLRSARDYNGAALSPPALVGFNAAYGGALVSTSGFVAVVIYERATVSMATMQRQHSSHGTQPTDR